MSKKQYGFLIIIAAAVISVFIFVIWPSANKASTDELSPVQTVDAYYDWYLEYIGSPESGDFRNPLVDGAYRESQYLTTSLIGHIDDVLRSFEGQSGYDPFLCAQDIPQEIVAEGTFYHDEGASIVVHTSFPNHFFTVDLQKSEVAWQIGNVTCGLTPEGTAKAFYTWYLAYIGDRVSGEMRNPLVDGAYRESGFLTESFIQRVVESLESETPGGGDPFLLAQDIPQAFSVDPGREPETAFVHLQFSEDSVQHLQVTFSLQEGRLLIDQIEVAQ